MSKILIIEDQSDIRENLEELLELSNYEVVTAENGEKGVDQLYHNPDLILCDIAMPKMNGYEVLETVKAKPETATIPFVFLSASAQERDIAAGKMAGVDAYLTKPVTSAELFETIESLLEN